MIFYTQSFGNPLTLRIIETVRHFYGPCLVVQLWLEVDVMHSISVMVVGGPGWIIASWINLLMGRCSWDDWQTTMHNLRKSVRNGVK